MVHQLVDRKNFDNIKMQQQHGVCVWELGEIFV
jgi:hypothetical protein